MSRLLFAEQWKLTNIERRHSLPPFTLNENVPGLINFGRRYVELNDPTGYLISIELLGDYAQFEHLMKTHWFRTEKAAWDREMDAKNQAEAIETLRGLAKSESDVTRLNAAKALLALTSKTPKRGAGRPSKDDITGALKAEVDEAKIVADDFDRIRAVK